MDDDAALQSTFDRSLGLFTDMLKLIEAKNATEAEAMLCASLLLAFTAQSFNFDQEETHDALDDGIKACRWLTQQHSVGEGVNRPRGSD